MTSLLRRKRRIIARLTTPTRTIASLACLGWLAAGPAPAQQPAPLRPLPTAAPIDRRDPAPLVPSYRPTAMPQPATLYYQKDPVRPARLTFQDQPAPAGVPAVDPS